MGWSIVHSLTASGGGPGGGEGLGYSQRRARTKSTQEDTARLLFANLPATSDWFQWPANKEKQKDATHSHRLPDLHPSLIRKEPKPRQRSITSNLVPQQLTQAAAPSAALTDDHLVSPPCKPQEPPSPVTQRAPHSHRKIVDATAAAPTSADVLEAAIAATTTDSQTQTEHTPKSPPARQARRAIGGWNMFQSQLAGAVNAGSPHAAAVIVAPEPVKKSGWALVAKAKETSAEEPNPLLMQALNRLGADLSHLHGHALPDLLVRNHRSLSLPATLADPPPPPGALAVKPGTSD
jgi:hypothetical protein